MVTAERYGLNGSTTGPAPLAADIAAAAQAGFRYLELRDTKIEAWLRERSLEGLRAEFEQAGVAPLSVNALEDATLSRDPRAIAVRCHHLCRWARAIGAPYVVAVPSFLEAGAHPDAGVRVRTVAALRNLAGIAEEYGLQLGFEFLGFGRCSVNTLAAARAIVDAVGDSRVGLVIDTFHFYVGHSTGEMLDGLDPQRLFIVHLDDAEDRPRAELTDAHRLLPGRGAIPLVRFVRQLEALGYRGAYSVELFRPEYYTWDPVHLAREARAALDRFFEEADRAEERVG
jgi:2-keto-myo-inositol isomerase